MCQRFPVLVGEIGSRMRDCRNPCNNRGPEEPTCMKDEMQACHHLFVAVQVSQHVTESDAALLLHLVGDSKSSLLKLAV